MRHAQATPNSIAILLDDQSLTYEQLLDQSQTLAAYLIQTCHVKKGDIIGQCCRKIITDEYWYGGDHDGRRCLLSTESIGSCGSTEVAHRRYKSARHIESHCFDREIQMMMSYHHTWC